MKLRSLLLAACGLAVFPAPAAAQDNAKFYEGKTIQLRIGYAPGGAYDLAGRLTARHLPKHIPGNPSIIAQNMPGGASLVLTKYLQTAAPKDGTQIGLISRGVAFEPLLKAPQSDFDPLAFNWIGNFERASSFCAAWHTSGIKSLADVTTGGKTFVIGGTGPASDDELFARVIREMFDANVKIVTGYPGSTNVHLAMERGEVGGRCNLSAADFLRKPEWMKDQLVNLFLQNGLKQHPEFKHIPLAVDVAKSEEQKAVLRLFSTRLEMAYPLVAPPGVPKERVDILRTAFNAMVKDPGFIEEANRQFIEVSLVTGEEIEDLIKKAYASDPKVVDRAVKLRNQ